MPPVDDNTLGINEENVTEISVMSAEESSFSTREQETLGQSGSLRHFEVDFSRMDLSFLSDEK